MCLAHSPHEEHTLVLWVFISVQGVCGVYLLVNTAANLLAHFFALDTPGGRLWQQINVFNLTRSGLLEGAPSPDRRARTTRVTRWDQRVARGRKTGRTLLSGSNTNWNREAAQTGGTNVAAAMSPNILVIDSA